MYEHMRDILTKADTAARTDVAKAYEILRALPIEDFVHINYYVPAQYKTLAQKWPRLADDQTQQDYVGEAGPRLEQMTAVFVRNFRALVSAHYGGAIRPDLRILDYGCGWGRILRMMPYFTGPSNVYGADPMSRSLELCRDLQVPGTFAACDPIPETMAFPGVTFDVAYAFSVFTHLSEEAARAVLSVVRTQIASDGVFLITIRPSEFWEVVAPRYGVEKVKALEKAHLRNEYAFVPVEELMFKGKYTYGDTSLSFDLLTRIARETGWKFSGAYERSVVDPYQIVVPLTPA